MRGSAQVADAPDADAPEPGITWGRLGDDPAWVGSFQNWLSDAYLPTAHAGEVPQPGPVHVVFADDIGGYRVALAQVPQASPNAQDPAQGNLWFAGPEGAGPTELTGLTFDEGREDDPFWSTVVPETVRDPIPWVVVTPEPLGGKVSSRESVVVALTAAARDLVLFARPDIAADGAVSWQRTRLRRSAPSVYTAVLRDLPPGPVTLRRPGGEVGTQWEDNAYSAMKDPIELQWGLRVVGEDEIPVRAFQPLYPGDLLQGVLPPLHEGFTPPDEQLRPAVHQAQRASGVAPQDSTRRLLASVSWRRTAPGTDVIAVTVPSGAHVVTVVHRPFSFVLDAVTVLPAGTLETAGLAWAEERPGVGNVVAVLRQKGAVSARVTVDGRRTRATGLRDHRLRDQGARREPDRVGGVPRLVGHPDRHDPGAREGVLDPAAHPPVGGDGRLMPRHCVPAGPPGSGRDAARIPWTTVSCIPRAYPSGRRDISLGVGRSVS